MVKCLPRVLNRTFAALADPTRRRILEQLAHGERCVTELARPHSMSLPAVSKHLRVLERAGLVSRQRSGRVHSLKLEAAPMKQAQEWIEEYRRFWEESFDRLDEYLRGNCSGVGQTSGLPVQGASGSLHMARPPVRARGPANRQTRGLPHART